MTNRQCIKCGAESPHYAKLCCVCGMPFPKSATAISDSKVLARMQCSVDQQAIVGKTLGCYNVLGAIGKGGMAYVFHAEHKDLRQPRALKILRDEYASSEMFVARFLNEARSAAAIDHPNVVRVFDAGSFNDRLFYIAMELVKGHNFADVIWQKGALNWKKCLKIIMQILDVLSLAHSMGIIHRDVKPGNIMVEKDMKVKLADFGHAMTAEDLLKFADPAQVFGTPEIMSPEQINGQPVDARTDIYGLGATMFQMLTARPLFAGTNVSTLFEKHLKEPPPAPADIVLSIPKWLSDMNLKMVAKDPAQRFGSTAEIMDLIRRNNKSSSGTPAG